MVFQKRKVGIQICKCYLVQPKRDNERVKYRLKNKNNVQNKCSIFSFFQYLWKYRQTQIFEIAFGLASSIFYISNSFQDPNGGGRIFFFV